VCGECSDPDMPADIKAAATGDGSILLVWRPPLHSNGILTKYTIIMKDMSDREASSVLFNVYVVLSVASLVMCRYISWLRVLSVIHRFVILPFSCIRPCFQVVNNKQKSQSRTIWSSFKHQSGRKIQITINNNCCQVLSLKNFFRYCKIDQYQSLKSVHLFFLNMTASIDDFELHEFLSE